MKNGRAYSNADIYCTKSNLGVLRGRAGNRLRIDLWMDISYTTMEYKNKVRQRHNCDIKTLRIIISIRFSSFPTCSRSKHFCPVICDLYGLAHVKTKKIMKVQFANFSCASYKLPPNKKPAYAAFPAIPRQNLLPPLLGPGHRQNDHLPK